MILANEQFFQSATFAIRDERNESFLLERIAGNRERPQLSEQL